jgi:hypothetical protein
MNEIETNQVPHVEVVSDTNRPHVVVVGNDDQAHKVTAYRRNQQRAAGFMGLLAAGSMIPTMGGNIPLPASVRRVFNGDALPAERECILPGCTKMTTRGYCSAEHCREHREQQRRKRKDADVVEKLVAQGADF